MVSANQVIVFSVVYWKLNQKVELTALSAFLIIQGSVLYKAHIYKKQLAPRRWVTIFGVTKYLQLHDQVQVVVNVAVSN